MTHRATLDVPDETVAVVGRALAEHRKTVDLRPWQRAATPYVQAVMVLRWFRDGAHIRVIARDARVSPATATCTRSSPPVPPRGGNVYVSTAP